MGTLKKCKAKILEILKTNNKLLNGGNKEMQNRNIKTLTEDTVIGIGKSIPLAKYREYFRKVIKDFAPEFFLR